MGINLDTIMMASAIASISNGIPARRVVACGNGSIATPHGTAAALKAEAPHNALSSHKVLADLVDSADDRRRFLGIAASRVAQRIARKAANRRKARRGWR